MVIDLKEFINSEKSSIEVMKSNLKNVGLKDEDFKEYDKFFEKCIAASAYDFLKNADESYNKGLYDGARKQLEDILELLIVQDLKNKINEDTMHEQGFDHIRNVYKQLRYAYHLSTKIGILEEALEDFDEDKEICALVQLEDVYEDYEIPYEILYEKWKDSSINNYTYFKDEDNMIYKNYEPKEYEIKELDKEISSNNAQ